MRLTDVDTLYARFCESVPAEIRPVARELAHRLGLAPIPGVPWSQIFSHSVTLAAPASVAEAFPRAEPEQIRLAVLAHMLAVIEAFGTDRVTDGQVAPDGALLEVLTTVRHARDRALHELDQTASYEAADQHSRTAMSREREWLGNAEPATYATYAKLSLDKQAVGFPASLALAGIAGAAQKQLQTLDRLLADVWLGLQHYDDVVDWEDDWNGGGAWAVCLAQGANGGEPVEPARGTELVRPLVLQSGMLTFLLGRARRHFRAAARRAGALGASSLAAWAEGRAEKLAVLWRAERRSSGFAVRQFRLAPFAAEVFS